jgi:hypothetical protein
METKEEVKQNYYASFFDEMEREEGSQLDLETDFQIAVLGLLTRISFQLDELNQPTNCEEINAHGK